MAGDVAAPGRHGRSGNPESSEGNLARIHWHCRRATQMPRKVNSARFPPERRHDRQRPRGVRSLLRRFRDGKRVRVSPG
jgi:hypothetical protein